MRKSQFHPYRSKQFKPLPENSQPPANLLPPSPLSENSLTITETTSNIRTKSQPLMKNLNPKRKKMLTIPPKKFQPSLKNSQPS